MGAPGGQMMDLGDVVDQVGEQGRELAVLDLLAGTAGTGLSFSAVLDAALASAAEIMAMPAGAIALWDAGLHCLRLAAQRNMPAPCAAGGNIPNADLHNRLIGQTPIFIADLQQDPAGALHGCHGLRALAAVPLLVHERFIGVLIVAGPEEHAFSSAERHTFLAIGQQVAVAIESIRLCEETARCAGQMRLLLDLGQRLSAILDLDALLKTIVVEVQARLRCRLAALTLLEGDRPRLAMAATAAGPLDLPADAYIDPGGLCTWVLQYGEPLCVPDLAAEPGQRCLPPVHDAVTRSAVAVPICLRERVLGILHADSDRPAAFDVLDVLFLQNVANQAGVAIENARTYARSEQRAATLRALLNTTRELYSTLDVRRLLQVIAQQVRTLIEVDSCVICLLNSESGILTPVVAIPEHADQALAMTYCPGEGIAGRVAASGVGEIVNRADLDPRAIPVPGAPARPTALLAAPLLYKGRVIGTMSLCRFGEREFAPADLELATSFAGQAAIAVENARLYTSSRRHAREFEQAHARLQQAQDQLLQAEKLSAVGRLAGGMAHELNNPLTAVIGFAQLLEASNLNPTARADVRRILAAANRAQKIVANLLAYSRQQRIVLERVDLGALTERILKLLAGDFAVGRVRVQAELENLPALYVDPLQIEQLLRHLLRNACRAMRGNGGTLTVRLSQPAPGLARLQVADEGTGIPADILPHIFDPFFTTAEVGQGPGLGLSACFGITQAHKGRIWAEPRPEGGTCFVVDLPLDPSTAQDEPAPDSCLALVVTHDESLAQALQRMLEEAGHRPGWVESGEAALAEIVVRCYDLVVCDVQLPGMGIKRLYESAGANDPHLAARFIAIGPVASALPGVPAVAAPVDPGRLRAAVSACLAKESTNSSRDCTVGLPLKQP